MVLKNFQEKENARCSFNRREFIRPNRQRPVQEGTEDRIPWPGATSSLKGRPVDFMKVGAKCDVDEC